MAQRFTRQDMWRIGLALGGTAAFVVAGEYQWPTLALVGLAMCLAAPLCGTRRPSMALEQIATRNAKVLRVCPQMPTHIGQRPARRMAHQAFARTHRRVRQRA